jgi:hypothetical protein
MADPKTTDFFDTLAKVLLRCGVLGYVLLLLSVGLILIAGDPIYRLNGTLFGLSKHELELIIYGCIVLMKVTSAGHSTSYTESSSMTGANGSMVPALQN